MSTGADGCNQEPAREEFDELKAALDELGRRALPVEEAERAASLIRWVRSSEVRISELEAKLLTAREDTKEACAVAGANWALDAGLKYGEPDSLLDAIRAAALPVKTWRCFICDDVFLNENEAKDHFTTGYEVPGCIDPLAKDEKARLKELRDAREDARRWLKEKEVAESAACARGDAIAQLKAEVTLKEKQRDAAEGTLDIIKREAEGEADEELANEYGGLGWEKHPASLAVRKALKNLEVELAATVRRTQAPLISDGPCVECKEPTNWSAADPGMWPVMLPTNEEPGVMKHHHVKCVLGWRTELERARFDAMGDDL